MTGRRGTKQPGKTRRCGACNGTGRITPGRDPHPFPLRIVRQPTPCERCNGRGVLG